MNELKPIDQEIWDKNYKKFFGEQNSVGIGRKEAAFRAFAIDEEKMPVEKIVKELNMRMVAR